MKFLYIFLSVIPLFFCTHSIDESRYVVEESGLSVHEQPSINSKMIHTLSFKEKVTVTQIFPQDITISGITGNWVQIKRPNGFVFGPYLSKSLPIYKSENVLGRYRGEYGEDKSIYGELILGKNESTLTLNFCHRTFEFKGNWTIKGGFVIVSIPPPELQCCPSLESANLIFRIENKEQLYYIGIPIYACSLGEAGRSLYKY